ncbi:hypothetical protein HZA33_01285 [Candidatus Pacearchaeota archaeon]|nr:hypothetical protein [Candidatus Pacearchaeota archaeon]
MSLENLTRKEDKKEKQTLTEEDKFARELVAFYIYLQTYSVLSKGLGKVYDELCSIYDKAKAE